MRFTILSLTAFLALVSVAEEDEFLIKPEDVAETAEPVKEAEKAKPVEKKTGPKPRKCFKCSGKGVVTVTVNETCERCEGTGISITEVELSDTKHSTDGYWNYRHKTTRKAQNKQPCPRCKRRGKIPVKKEVECSVCKGAGLLGKGGRPYSAEKTEAAALLVDPVEKIADERAGKGDGKDEPLSLENIGALNARLKYKSFCGVEFGTVEERIGQHTGNGGELAKPFRHFRRFTRWGSKVFHRVARVSLEGEVSNASDESFREEVRKSAAVIGEKYGVKFQPVRNDKECIEVRYEDEYASVTVGGRCVNGEARFYVSFLNKQVETQNDEIWARHPGNNVTLPSNDGLNVL